VPPLIVIFFLYSWASAGEPCHPPTPPAWIFKYGTNIVDRSLNVLFFGLFLLFLDLCYYFLVFFPLSPSLPSWKTRIVVFARIFLLIFGLFFRWLPLPPGKFSADVLALTLPGLTTALIESIGEWEKMAVFGDARFWFRPKAIHFYLTKSARGCGCIPSSFDTDRINNSDQQAYKCAFLSMKMLLQLRTRLGELSALPQTL